jgi:hypothetical protein
MARRYVLATCLLIPLVAWSQVLARPAVIGQAVTAFSDVGEHYPLFLVAKSHHPENLTVVYTKLDAHCRVLPDPAHSDQPTLDFYWLMDSTHYKPMAALLKNGIRARLQFPTTRGHHAEPTTFTVRLADLVRLTHDLPSPTVQITTARHGEACVAMASLTLGPSDGHATMKVESIFTHTEVLTLRKKIQVMADPDALQVYAVTMQGADAMTGQPLERTYRARPCVLCGMDTMLPHGAQVDTPPEKPLARCHPDDLSHHTPADEGRTGLSPCVSGP